MPGFFGPRHSCANVKGDEKRAPFFRSCANSLVHGNQSAFVHTNFHVPPEAKTNILEIVIIA